MEDIEMESPMAEATSGAKRWIFVSSPFVRYEVRQTRG